MGYKKKALSGPYSVVPNYNALSQHFCINEFTKRQDYAVFSRVSEGNP